jgi:hypothetical protein
MLEASCHCGAVKLGVPSAPTQLTSCNCSICRRLGTLWCYYTPPEVRITGATATYQWGDKTLDLHRCTTCGCVTHWSPVDPALNRMGVNARLLDPVVITDVRVRRFDGADTWEFLD